MERGREKNRGPPERYKMGYNSQSFTREKQRIICREQKKKHDQWERGFKKTKKY